MVFSDSLESLSSLEAFKVTFNFTVSIHTKKIIYLLVLLLLSYGLSNQEFKYLYELSSGIQAPRV